MGLNPTLWTVFTMNILIQKFTNLLRSTFFNSILKRCIKVFYLLYTQWSKLFKQVPLPSTRSFGRVGLALVGVSSIKKPAYLVNATRIHNRKYSTAKVINSCNNLDASLSEFYQWFVGFSDGESSFQIQVRYTDASKTIVRGINFSFTIALHVDDLALLQFIKDKLGIGNIAVKRSRDVCVFTVTNKEGLYKLLFIFDKYNLNTTKYLDYLDFRKAFLLHHERDIKEYNKCSDKNKIKSQIVELKNGMNSQRTYFDMFSLRGDKLAITKSWLLGFIEAEGSFFISRTDIEPSFSIELSKTQLFLLEAIKEFLIDSLGFDKYSIHILKSSTFNVFAVNEQKEKPSVIFIVKNIRVLNNYLVPYFNTLVFNSKKGKDFFDWKLICDAVYKGSHKKESIRALILRLSYTMNSYRLSTNLAKGSIESLTENERNTVREALPTREHLEDGRLLDVETGQVTINRSLCVYEVIRPDGEILILDSFNDILNILGVGFRTLKRHVNEDTLGNATEFRGYIIRRVAVFLNNK